MTTENNNADLIIGLKSEVSRQVGFKNWEADCKDYTTSCLIKSWKSSPADMVEGLVWEYVENAPFSLWKKCKSDLVGVFSKIGEYENKKGVKSQAHFTENGKYIGSVKKLGDKPIGYEGNFQIKRDKFVFDATALPTCKSVGDLFRPYFVPPEPVVVPTPEPEPKKVVIKVKKAKVEKPKPNLIIVESEDEDEEENIPIAKLIEKKKTEKKPKLQIKEAEDKGKCGAFPANPKFIQIPFVLMGCCGDANAVAKVELVPIPKVMNKDFFETLARTINKYPLLDWDWTSLARNVIHPNLDLIATEMGLDEKMKNRVGNSLYVVLNNWDSKHSEEELQQAEEAGFPLLYHGTFFTHEDCEF